MSEPVTYTEAQRQRWINTHRDFRSGSLSRGDARVLISVPGEGTCLVSLRSLEYTDESQSHS